MRAENAELKHAAMAREQRQHELEDEVTGLRAALHSAVVGGERGNGGGQGGLAF